MNGYNKNNRMEYDEKRDNFDLDFGFTQTDNSFPDFGIDSTYENTPARDYNFPAQDYNSPARDYNTPAQDFNTYFPEVPFEDKSYTEEEKTENEAASAQTASGKQKKPPPTPPIAYKILLTSYGVMLLACIILAFLGEAWSFCALLPIMAFTFQFFYCHHPRNRTKPAVISLFLEAAAISAVYFLRMSFPEYFETMSRNIIGSIFGMGVACAGIALIIGNIAEDVNNKKRCTTPVETVCTGIKKIKHSQNHKHRITTYYTYHPVYEFDFEGAHYEIIGASLDKNDPDPKNTTKVFVIDPEYPFRSIGLKGENGSKGSVLGAHLALLTLGLFFTLFGLFVFYISVNPRS